ncbi:MAG TPA: zf-HC2 domain-containing protein [Pyrinomonadaceae bacterium]|nr:zf-HC2 domain-containing protein [Pyrinomonadaceae bacterium]
MNCNECQDNISPYLDGELDDLGSANMRTHLSICAGCAKVCEDFSVILESCRDTVPSEIIPPNSQALWCRINNLIESEIKPEVLVEEPKKGWFARGWNLTFSQAGAAVMAVAMISSLLTVVGIRNYFEPTGDDFTSRSAASQTTFEKMLSKIGLTDTPQQARERRIKEQQAAIAYWTNRVQERRGQWNAKMRDAFDRNLNLIDESVSEYTNILQENPDDDLTGEMLDTVLTDKMDLLREFSDL